MNVLGDVVYSGKFEGDKKVFGEKVQPIMDYMEKQGAKFTQRAIKKYPLAVVTN